MGHRVVPLQGHREAGSAGHESDQLVVERPAAVHLIEGTGLALGEPHQAGGAKHEARGLQVRHDLPGLAAGDGVGLYDPQGQCRCQTIPHGELRETFTSCSSPFPLSWSAEAGRHPPAVRMIPIPASSNAAIFSAAVPDDPGDDRAGVPHAPARRRGLARDEPDDRLASRAPSRTPRPPARRCRRSRRSSRSPSVSGSASKAARQSMKLVPMIGIAADAHAGGLADARAGELVHHLVGQRAAARLPRRRGPAVQMLPGMMPTLVCAGRDEPGAVRADQPRAALRTNGWHARHVA